VQIAYGVNDVATTKLLSEMTGRRPATTQPSAP
jgi:hypothetical protein